MKKYSFVIGLVLTIFLLWPLMVAPYFKSQDDVAAIRLYEMDKCIKDLQIPCRWVPDLGGLYGYPLFNYYAPLPFYFGEIFYLLTSNLLFSVKMIYSFSFIGAFVFMYLIGRKLWGELGGTVSAIFYSYAPYHAVDFYVRTAVGELWALTFYPAILWALMRLYEKRNVKNSLLTSFFIFCLVTSHNLSTLIFFPIILVLIFVLSIKEKGTNFIKYSFGALILGLVLSAFYWLPALGEKNLAHVETTVVGYFSYTEHFKGFKKLLLDREWGYGASVREIPGGERDNLPYQIGIVHVATFLLVIGLLMGYRRYFRETKLLIGMLSFLAIFCVFMIHPRSVFLWNLLEPLKYLQFPWRFLGPVTFILSLLAGSVFLVFNEKKYRSVVWGILVVLVVVLNFSYFKPEKFVYISDKDLLSGALWEKYIMRSIFDFLPKSAKAPPAELASAPYEIKPDEVIINNYYQGSNWISFDAEVKSLTYIKLSQYYFPNWEVTANNQKRLINSNNELGLITFTLDPGNYKVLAKLHDTPIRVVANLITTFGFILASILIILQFPNGRRWLNYYIKRIG